MHKIISKPVLIAIVLILALGALSGCGKKIDLSDADNAPMEEINGDVESNPLTESDFVDILNNGSLKIGITIFDPMNYYDDDGKLIGFDTEFAEAVCEKIGVTPDFIEINWDTKEVELAAKSIDCIWNGLTVTEERKENMAFSDSYIKNMQVVVIRAADKDKYTSVDSLADANICAEMSSAGEDAVKADPILSNAPYTASGKQTDTLLEVKSGTSDAAVLDYTLAKSMVGEGTNYSDLMILSGVELAAEEYAIGFRLGSDTVSEVNQAIAALIADGTLDKIAEKYDLTASLLSNQ